MGIHIVPLINGYTHSTITICYTISLYLFFTLKYLNLASLLFNFILYIIYGLSITCGLHLLWTHQSYNTYNCIKWFIMFINCGTLMYPIEVWCSSHIMHHTLCENKLVSLLALGEGFHNYHHTYSKDFRTLLNCNGLNLSAKVLYQMYRLGLVWDCS